MKKKARFYLVFFIRSGEREKNFFAFHALTPVFIRSRVQVKRAAETLGFWLIRSLFYLRPGGNCPYDLKWKSEHLKKKARKHAAFIRCSHEHLNKTPPLKMLT